MYKDLDLYKDYINIHLEDSENVFDADKTIVNAFLPMSMNSDASEMSKQNGI